MADLISTTASNGPKVTDCEAVQRILERYHPEQDLHVGIGPDEETGAVHFHIWGHTWPRAWRIPEGAVADTFDPYESDDTYDAGPEDFERLLLEIAQHLAEPLTVQAVGAERCRFPLLAGEWHVEPGGSVVQTSGFRHA
ncbi:MAG: hypothetical protein JNM56_23635 [Planctomycetia bacterium]|nr:hypothetical protein [Planctomycetia bacterium]